MWNRKVTNASFMEWIVRGLLTSKYYIGNHGHKFSSSSAFDVDLLYLWSRQGDERTVRRRLVAIPWSLLLRELFVGLVLSLSLLWRGHDCRTCAVVCASSLQGLFLAGISWSVHGAIVSEGCRVGDYSLHFCAWSRLASCFWWAFLLLGN